MQEIYWDRLAKDYQFYSTPTLEFIANFIINREFNKVFEASSGTGYFIKLLRGYGYKGEYTGSDYCDTFINASRLNNPDERFIKVNLMNKIAIAENDFDVSVVHHGIDYVYPYKKAFKELKRISSKYVVMTLWRAFVDDNHIGFTEEGGWNVNDYEKKEWYKEIDKAGYKIIIDADIKEWNAKYQKIVYNHLFILQV